MPMFRVHYDLQSIAGVVTEHRDVEAATPDEAAAIVANTFKPKPIAVHKVKKLREGLDA